MTTTTPWTCGVLDPNDWSGDGATALAEWPPPKDGSHLRGDFTEMMPERDDTILEAALFGKLK